MQMVEVFLLFFCHEQRQKKKEQKMQSWLLEGRVPCLPGQMTAAAAASHSRKHDEPWPCAVQSVKAFLYESCSSLSIFMRSCNAHEK
jgi:hypothetical protein